MKVTEVCKVMKQYFSFQWHITDDSNQRCKHCYIFLENNCKKLDFMSWEQMKETFYNCLDFCEVYDRVPYFYITGGDPILHPDFWKLMELMKEHRIAFTIFGNPLHLTDGVCQDKEVNEKLGKIKRANSNPHMATATSYVSKEQPSIADDPKILNAFYDAPTVITMFAPRNFLFSVDDCAVAAENMILMATSLDIGSCYIGQGWTAFADPYGQEILRKWQIPDGYYAVMQLLLGYPKKEDRHPSAKPRKEKRILRF